MPNSFIANGVASTIDKATGEVVLIFKSETGAMQPVTLDTGMQATLLKILLSKTPGAPTEILFHSRTLLAKGVQPFRLASGHPGLQFLITPTQAIDIAFDQDGIVPIQNALTQLASNKPLGPRTAH